MRHLDLCEMLDDADATLKRRDFVAADRIRTAIYASGLLLSWFAAEQVGIMMANARTEDRRPTVADLKSIAA